jgi:glutamate--cysteine ligase
LGLSLRHLRFLELFLLCCLLRESPPLDAAEKAEASRNALDVACRGRTPGLLLRRGGKELSLRDWVRELADDLRAVADILDAGEAERGYLDSLNPLLEAIDNPEATPSARILSEMRSARESFHAHALRMSHQHAQGFRSRPLEGEKAAALAREAENSLAAQRHTEDSDTLSFDEFLVRYFSQVE